jgi:hypothetical protein
MTEQETDPASSQTRILERDSHTGPPTKLVKQKPRKKPE